MKDNRYRPPSRIGVQLNNDLLIPGDKIRWGNPEYCERLDKADRLREAAKLPMKPVEDIPSLAKTWLFKNWIEQRQLTLITGLPTTGKSTLACALAAAVTRGKGHPLFRNFGATGTGYVIFVCREDDIQTTLKDRLYAAGADMSKILIINDDFGEHGESPFSINSERDRARLLGFSESINHNIGMIVLDPVYQAVDGDFNNDYRARAAYEKLVKLAKQLKCAIVGICHDVKNPRDKDPLARIAGPQALRLVPRSIILLSEIMGKQTENGGAYVMLHAKHNEGKMDVGYEYCLSPCCVERNGMRSEPVVFNITGEIFGRPHEILEWADAKPAKSKQNKTDIAMQFLLEKLDGEGKVKSEILELAAEAGIKNGTLMLAKSRLPIVAKKRKGDGQSVWYLSNTETPSRDE